jgi:septal ring factor EnvC (AmiA/AmiB activator)
MSNTFLYTSLTLLSVCTIYNLFWFKKETEKLNMLITQHDKNIEQYNKNVEQHNKNVDQHNKNYKELYWKLSNLHSSAHKLTIDFKKTKDIILQLNSKINQSEDIHNLLDSDDPSSDKPSLENIMDCDTFSIISCDIDKYAYASKADKSILDNSHWLFNIF